MQHITIQKNTIKHNAKQHHTICYMHQMSLKNKTNSHDTMQYKRRTQHNQHNTPEFKTQYDSISTQCNTTLYNMIPHLALQQNTTIRQDREHTRNTIMQPNKCLIPCNTFRVYPCLSFLKRVYLFCGRV